jgi:hypothetical protein
LTDTRPFPVIVAVPITVVTLFFFISPFTPAFSCLATPRERLTTASRS